MRKQTKLVAVASAAALLAVGASMTSFAATGWAEEDGQWFFYDKDGNRVENTWKKSGDNWYWLDSEEGGAMAVDKLIEDGDDTYYVDSNGVMVRNTWVKVVNEEQDDESDPAEYIYYYMQSNGRAYKTKSDSTQFKTIDGKRYAFDEDGKMLYGWVDDNHERVDDENWHDEGVYYLGAWDDGAMKTGWQKIYVEENEGDDEGEEKEFWFNFKSNGKKRVSDSVDEISQKTINGKKYGFDYRGVMAYEWAILNRASATEAGHTRSDANGNVIYANSASDWRYFNSIEDGKRVSKGWFKVVAPEEDNDNTFNAYGENYSFALSDADDEKERWYYADTNGELYTGVIKKIKGKYYAFRPDGGKASAMLNGLVLMSVTDDQITYVYDDDVDADDLDLLITDNKWRDSDGVERRLTDPNATLFYFGSDEDHDGAMKTGTVTVNLDGDAYNFKFSKVGGAEGKGRGITGIDDKKYVYKYGLKLKADSDDKYMVVYVNGDAASGNAQVAKISSQELRDVTTDLGRNKDGESVEMVGALNSGWTTSFKLLSTSGTIVKDKTAAKDGADWYFYVDKEQIIMYLNNKTLRTSSTNPAPALDTVANWKSWKKGTFGTYAVESQTGLDSYATANPVSSASAQSEE